MCYGDVSDSQVLCRSEAFRMRKLARLWHFCGLAECLPQIDFTLFQESSIPQELIEVPATHHLRLRLVNIECDELAAACIFKMCAPEAILHLRLPAHRSIVEWHRYTNLRSLGFCGSAQLDDELLLHISTQCPWIVNLDISKAALITDNGVTAIAPVVHELHSINLESVQGVRTSLVKQACRKLCAVMAPLFGRFTCTTARMCLVTTLLKLCVPMY
eukprot:Colp12_sorted_trinity150504_noHs@33445